MPVTRTCPFSGFESRWHTTSAKIQKQKPHKNLKQKLTFLYKINSYFMFFPDMCRLVGGQTTPLQGGSYVCGCLAGGSHCGSCTQPWTTWCSFQYEQLHCEVSRDDDSTVPELQPERERMSLSSLSEKKHLIDSAYMIIHNYTKQFKGVLQAEYPVLQVFYKNTAQLIQS